MALTLGLGFLIAARDPRLRALNDRISGTRLIRFTIPRPELYRVQDLRTVDREGTLQSESAASFARETTAVESGEYEQVDSDSVETEPAIEATDIAAPQAETAGDTLQTEQTGANAVDKGSLYVRPAEETAHERKMRAALGPTVEDLATALRRTAAMVAEGQLTQKVLDRKREDFVEKMKSANLGETPTEAVKTIVELGKEGLLTRFELEEVTNILRKRLGR
jgi:hypothetical protein